MAHHISCRRLKKWCSFQEIIPATFLTISGRCRKRCHNTLQTTAASTHWANLLKRVASTSQVRYSSSDWVAQQVQSARKLTTNFQTPKKWFVSGHFFWWKQQTLGFSRGEEAAKSNAESIVSCFFVATSGLRIFYDKASPSAFVPIANQIIKVYKSMLLWQIRSAMGEASKSCIVLKSFLSLQILLYCMTGTLFQSADCCIANKIMFHCTWFVNSTKCACGERFVWTQHPELRGFTALQYNCYKRQEPLAALVTIILHDLAISL